MKLKNVPRLGPRRIAEEWSLEPGTQSNTEILIPTGINQNPWAHFRRPIDMIFQG